MARDTIEEYSCVHSRPPYEVIFTKTKENYLELSCLRKIPGRNIERNNGKSPSKKEFLKESRRNLKRNP